MRVSHAVEGRAPITLQSENAAAVAAICRRLDGGEWVRGGIIRSALAAIGSV